MYIVIVCEIFVFYFIKNAFTFEAIELCIYLFSSRKLKHGLSFAEACFRDMFI